MLDPLPPDGQPFYHASTPVAGPVVLGVQLALLVQVHDCDGEVGALRHTHAHTLFVCKPLCTINKCMCVCVHEMFLVTQPHTADT